MSSILFRKRLLIYGHLPSFLLLCCTVYFLNNNPTPPFEFPSHPTITYCTRKHARTLLLMPVSNGLRQEWPAPLQEVVCSPVLMPGSTYFVLCFAKFFFPLMSHIPCFKLFLGKRIWSVWEVNAFDSISFSSGLSFALVPCSQKLQWNRDLSSSIIYVPLTWTGVHWVAFDCPEGLQMPLEISSSICRTIM